MAIADGVLGSPSGRRVSRRWIGAGALGVVALVMVALALVYESRSGTESDGIPRELYEEGVLLGGADAATLVRRVEERSGLELNIPHMLLDGEATLLRADSYLAPGPFGGPTVRVYYDIWPRVAGEMLATTVGFNVIAEETVVAWEEVDLGMDGVRARMLVDMEGTPPDVQIWAMRDGLQVSLRVRGPSVPDDIEVVMDAMRELIAE